MVPIPATGLKLLEKAEANFSLLSPRVVEWTQNKRGDFSSSTEMMQKLAQKSVSAFSASNKSLEKIQERQKSYIDYLKEMNVITFGIKAKSSSPFITGLGPASSIKGVLRLSQAINCADVNGSVDENDERIVKYFGATSDAQEAKRGQLVILDAYPDSGKVPKLKVDIMNPHFGKYYSGENKQPVETESPVPIKFLTVKEGTSFVFRCAFMPLGNKILSENERKKIQDDLDAMFKTAFETVGFGGKTSIGYGRFKIV